MATVLQSPFFIELVLPFVLVFAVVFAVLQKTEVLGKDKKQVDSIVALVIGLLFVSFGRATDIVNNLVPFLVVSLVIILVFMLLIGMLFKGGEFDLNDKVKWAITGIVSVALIIAVLVVTNAWDYLAFFFSGEGGSEVVTNIVFVVIVVIALTVVVLGGGKGSDK
jgi:peptidoglycan/LPS O-acetylase OafA/YrhL